MSKVENLAAVFAPLVIDGESREVNQSTSGLYSFSLYLTEKSVVSVDSEATLDTATDPEPDWAEVSVYKICGDHYDTVDAFIRRISNWSGNLIRITDYAISGEYVGHRLFEMKTPTYWGFNFETALVVYTQEEGQEQLTATQVDISETVELGWFV